MEMNPTPPENNPKTNKQKYPAQLTFFLLCVQILKLVTSDHSSNLIYLEKVFFTTFTNSHWPLKPPKKFRLHLLPWTISVGPISLNKISLPLFLHVQVEF